ncbi:unnamed protein product [Urochloa humidicola]
MEMGRRKKEPDPRASSCPCLDSAAAAPRSRSLAAGARTGARRGSCNQPLSARSSAPFASNPAAWRRRRRRGEGGNRSGGAAEEHDLDPLRAWEAEEEVDCPAREPGRRRSRGAVAAPRRAGHRCPGARWSFGRRGAAAALPVPRCFAACWKEGKRGVASSGHRELMEWRRASGAGGGAHGAGEPAPPPAMLLPELAAQPCSAEEEEVPTSVPTNGRKRRHRRNSSRRRSICAALFQLGSPPPPSASRSGRREARQQGRRSSIVRSTGAPPSPLRKSAHPSLPSSGVRGLKSMSKQNRSSYSPNLLIAVPPVSYTNR